MEAETTRDDLYQKAQDLDIQGRSGMSKEELQAAIDETMRQGGRPTSQEPPKRPPTGNWIRDHLLTLILLGLFLLSMVGQFYFQYQDEVNHALQHNAEPPAVFSAEYLNAFWSSALENWQSEFLQLASFVILATYFIHRGSPQSRDGTDEMHADIKAIRRKLGA